MQKHNTKHCDYIAIISLPITYYNINFPIYEKNPSNPLLTIQKPRRHQKLASAIY
jgi:hypothetical protein